MAAGSEPIQISVWEQDSRYQINPHITKYLRGNTQFALSKEAAADRDDSRDGR